MMFFAGYICRFDPRSMLIDYKAEQLQIGELDNRLLADGWRCMAMGKVDVDVDRDGDGDGDGTTRRVRAGKQINLVDVAASSLSSAGRGPRCLIST